MPFINSRGDVAHGVGGGYCNLNNQRVAFGGVLGWWDDETIAFCDGNNNWLVSLYHVPTKTTTILDERYGGPPGGVSANVGYCSNNKQAAWWFGTNDPVKVGLWSTVGLRAAAAGLMGMGPDGAIGYKPDYQSMGPTLVREPDGRTWQISAGSTDNLRLLGQSRALWCEGLRPRTIGGLPTLAMLDGAYWMTNASFCGGEWWFSAFHDKQGTILHPFANYQGFSIQAIGDNWHTHRAISDSIIRVACSRGIAEQAGEIWVRDYDVVQNLVRDPWGANTWAPIPRVDVRTINASHAKPVTSLPPLPDARWGGYYKVSGRYGDYTNTAVEVKANIVIGGLGEEDNSLSDADKAARQVAWMNECKQNGLAISCGSARADIELCKPFWDMVAFIYITAEGTPVSWTDMSAVEKQVTNVEAILKDLGLPRRPMMLYIDADISTGNYSWPKGIDWQALNLYLGPESPANSDTAIAQLRALWARQERLIPNDKKIMLVCQAYDRNGAWKDIDVLMDMQPEYQTLMKDSRVVGALFFALSRPGGVTTYPQLKDWHKQIFQSIPSVPRILIIPWPAPPPVPPPEPPPEPPPVEPPPEPPPPPGPPPPPPPGPPEPPVPPPAPRLNWWQRFIKWLKTRFKIRH